MSRRDKGCCAAASASGTTPRLHLSRACMDDSELKKLCAQYSLHSRNLTLCLWSWKLKNSYQDQNAVIPFGFTANSVRMNISHLPDHHSFLQPLLSKLCFPSLRSQVFSKYCSKAVAVSGTLMPVLTYIMKKTFKNPFPFFFFPVENSAFPFKRAGTIKIRCCVALIALGWAIIALPMLQHINLSSIKANFFPFTSRLTLPMS